MSPDRLIRDAAGLGWDLPALQRAGTLKIIFTTRQVFVDELLQTDSLLLEAAAEIGARRMFVDGIPSLTGVSRNDVGRGARRLSHPRRRAAADESDRSPRGRADRLQRSADGGAARGSHCRHRDPAAHGRGHPVHGPVDRDREVARPRFPDGPAFVQDRRWPRDAVYRRVQAPRSASRDQAAAFDPTTRITTGVPGLDPLVNGGYFLGSTTVVAGISGVGKSVMGLQYLAEGARLGQRSLMLSLDEPVQQIIRNANSIGIDLQHCIDSGIVRVQYDTPQEIEIDRHFHDLEALIEEFKPTRVLFDSLSTYGSNLGTTGRMFRDFFHALVALMKEHQTATVYNHENPEMLGMASMMGEFAMSSLVDNIVLMNWIELGRAFRLGLTVAKMRGNPNARETHECEIVNGHGMRVLPDRFRRTRSVRSGAI